MALSFFGPDLFNATGLWVVAMVAVAVAIFGIAQLMGLRRYLAEHRADLGRYRYCVAVDVAAAEEAVWRVVSDLGAIAEYVPSLASSRLVANKGSSQGALSSRRQCTSMRGDRWSEHITRFDEERHAFDVRFATEAPDFPFPLRVMHGGWQLESRPSGHTRVAVWWSLTPKVPLAGLVIVALMAASVDRDFPAIIERMAATANGLPHPTKPRSKLIPAYC